MSGDNTELIQTRITASEQARIAAKADLEGISVAAYVRRLIKLDLAKKEKR